MEDDDKGGKTRNRRAGEDKRHERKLVGHKIRTYGNMKNRPKREMELKKKKR